MVQNHFQIIRRNKAYYSSSQSSNIKIGGSPWNLALSNENDLWTSLW